LAHWHLHSFPTRRSSDLRSRADRGSAARPSPGMSRYLAARAGQAVVAIFFALTAVFFLVRITGDPVILFLPLDVQPKDIAEFRQDRKSTRLNSSHVKISY